ncbi:MAG: S8 family serine peptidase [Bacteroides sp.]|nr:S8 family serine peptidase [Bacteroides sp.]
MKKLISILSAICLVVTMIPFSAYAADITPEISLEEFSEQLSEMNEEYADEPVSNRLIVKSERKIDKLDSVDIVEGYDDLHIVQFDNSESAEQALEHYNTIKYIEYAEEDIPMSTSEMSSGITYDNHLSWGSESIGVDDYVDYLGNVSALPEIVVGIIDTGIDLDHEFLKDRIIPTGINYSDSGTESSEDDDNGHGTHVAGIIADNTTENVKLKAYKCMNNTGTGISSNIVMCLLKAIEDKVNVINMSLGARSNSDVYEDIINNATQQGIAVCVSAGNDGANADNYIPANVDSAITVAAIDYNDSFPYWTNYGDCVDIIAPGVSIYSSYIDGEYKSLSGTSMASPFVAAACALIKSKDINISVDKISATLESNGRDCSPPNRLSNKHALYIGNISTYDYARTPAPTFSIESGRYDDRITLEINCSDNEAEIYYTLDGNRASQNNGILYTQPIIVDCVTTIHAVSYSAGKLKSLQSKADYYITHTDSNSNFIVDSNGTITKYLGNSKYLTIPDNISGISVTGIGDNVFKNSDIVMIKFPDTLTYIGNSAFSNCQNLISVYANNIEIVGNEGFYHCRNLVDINLSNLTSVGQYAFFSCILIPYVKNDRIKIINEYSFGDLSSAVSVSFTNVTTVKQGGLMDVQQAKSIFLPELETVYPQAFEGCYSINELNFQKLKTLIKVENAEYFGHCEALEFFYAPNITGDLPNYSFRCCQNLRKIILNNITNIGKYAFDFCQKLETIYISNVKTIDLNAFSHCKNIKMIFAPNLENTKVLPECNGINIYLSDKFTSSSAKTTNTYNIIAPSGSNAEQWAKDNGHTFIPSDYRDTANDKLDDTDDLNVRAYGRSIRITNAGLRFGFSWDTIPEIQDLASNVEYGFVYHYNYDNEPFSSNKLTVDNVGTDNVKMKKAVNLDDTTEGKTVFNLVFTNIPDSNQDTNISVRAYVCIDGMYFYSNSLNGSFAEVSSKVLEDDEIDQSTKTMVKQLLRSEV